MIIDDINFPFHFIRRLFFREEAVPCPICPSPQADAQMECLLAATLSVAVATLRWAARPRTAHQPSTMAITITAGPHWPSPTAHPAARRQEGRHGMAVELPTFFPAISLPRVLPLPHPSPATSLKDCFLCGKDDLLGPPSLALPSLTPPGWVASPL